MIRFWEKVFSKSWKVFRTSVELVREQVNKYDLIRDCKLKECSEREQRLQDSLIELTERSISTAKPSPTKPTYLIFLEFRPTSFASHFVRSDTDASRQNIQYATSHYNALGIHRKAGYMESLRASPHRDHTQPRSERSQI